MASVVDRPFSGDLSYHNCDTLLFEKDTGQPCGLISHTCSNYCSWSRPVIRGNLANVPRVRHRLSYTTRALQFACILGSRLHCLCNLHGSLKRQIRLRQQLFLNLSVASQLAAAYIERIKVICYQLEFGK